MPKRTFIPNLLKYRRKHGFLIRAKNSRHIINRQRTLEMQKKTFPKLGPRSSFCNRRDRPAWFPTFP